MAAALELPIIPDDRAQGWAVTDAKFAAPLGPRVFVPRPRLEKLFGDPRANGARGTISAAPVGSGKTSTLGDVARNLPAGTAAWCTLDRHDNDPFVFGCSVLEAILAAESDQPDDAWLPATSPTRAPLQQAGQLAANSLGMLLVLAHVEDLRVNAIGGTIARLVHMLPSTLSLVLLAQQDPDLPVRLRTSTDVREGRVADFAFTLDEARVLFNGHGVALDDDELDTIVNWTR